MDCWITGGAGFLGSRVCRALRSQGHRTLSLDRRASPDADQHETLDLSRSEAPDRLRELRLDRGRPDVVIHAAGLTAQPERVPHASYVTANTLATAHLCEALDELSPELLIFTSTLSVYGRPVPSPVNEQREPSPVSAYAVTKLAGEQLLLNSASRARVVVLRLPSLFGSEQADSFVDGLVRQARAGTAIQLFSRGGRVRDALHVDDAVGAVVACARHRFAEPRLVMHLGGDSVLTVAEYARLVVDVFSSSSPLVPVDTPSSQTFDLLADIRLARQRLGFEPMEPRQALLRYADQLRTRP